jgi:hypothetical protein
MTRMPTAVAVLVVAFAACSNQRGHLNDFDAGAVEDFAPGSVTTFGLSDSTEMARAVDGHFPGDDDSALASATVIFHLVRLEDGTFQALYAKDTSSGCIVPWRPDFVFDGRRGWFRDPCRGGTMTGTARAYSARRHVTSTASRSKSVTGMSM